MHHYHNYVYENHFAHKNWIWPEYEYWKKIFIKYDKWPVKWRKWERSNSIETLQVKDRLELMTVAALTGILKNLGVASPKKPTKQTLIDLLLSQPNIFQIMLDNQDHKKICEQYTNNRNKALYEMLMLTIWKRAKCLHDFNRQKMLGISKRKLCVCFPEDKVFADIALAKNKNALTPLFPGDLSTWKSIIPGFNQ